MTELLFLALGIFIGSVLAKIIIYLTSGKGYFSVSSVSPEDDLYSISVRLIENQKLDKKKTIVLVRDRITDDSQK